MLAIQILHYMIRRQEKKLLDHNAFTDPVFDSNTLKRRTSCPFRNSRGDRVLTQKKRNRCACVRCYTQILTARCQPPNVPSIPAHDRLEKTPTQGFLTQRRHLCIAHNIAVSPCVAYLYLSWVLSSSCLWVVGGEIRWWNTGGFRVWMFG